MGRKGNTLAIKSDYGIVLPCTGEPHTFRGERARKLFLRLHRKKCQICRDAEKPAEEHRQTNVASRLDLSNTAKFLNHQTTNALSLEPVSPK